MKKVNLTDLIVDISVSKEFAPVEDVAYLLSLLVHKYYLRKSVELGYDFFGVHQNVVMVKDLKADKSSNLIMEYVKAVKNRYKNNPEYFCLELTVQWDDKGIYKTVDGDKLATKEEDLINL